MMALTGCKSAPDKHYLEALCKFIPDHGLKVEARKYLTEDYFNAYSEAFEAPTGSYGEIGEGEWLFYFVSGNGDGQPVFAVKDFQRDGRFQERAGIILQHLRKIIPYDTKQRMPDSDAGHSCIWTDLDYQMCTRSSSGRNIGSPSLMSNASKNVWKLRSDTFTRFSARE